MKASLYTVFYAVALGVVCAAALTGAGRFTEPYRKANAEAEEVRHILGVLEIPFDRSAPPRELLEVSGKYVRTEERGGIERHVYAHPETGETRAVAVPLAGPGLWGPIRGFLALEPDMETVRGVTFHEQEETPGLGGEISSESFLSQFEGKSIRGPEGGAGLRIVPDGADAANEVDAISGATMTCDKVQAILNAAIRALADGEVEGDAR
jgi:Na+-transporting NADH:ubiquinone oxidoreductase subunit C